VRDVLEDEWQQDHRVRVIGEGEVEEILCSVPSPPMLLDAPPDAVE
jgi:hypothetical protein